MYVDQFGISTQQGNPPYGCRISQGRIIALSIVSMGVYWLYWMYRTWQQYRDHTLEQAAETGQTHYPVWHGLTQLVPVYGFFRFHAHIRHYKALMQERGVAESLNLGALTTIVVINVIAGWLGGGIRSSDNDLLAAMGGIITVVTILVSIVILCQMQSNLNNYWDANGGAPALSARFGKGEILCIFLGILLWVGVIADLIW